MRMDLAERQEELSFQMKRFEGFVRDNETKRRRALAKCVAEGHLIEAKSAEAADLKVEFRKAKMA